MARSAKSSLPLDESPRSSVAPAVRRTSVQIRAARAKTSSDDRRVRLTTSVSLSDRTTLKIVDEAMSSTAGFRVQPTIVYTAAQAQRFEGRGGKTFAAGSAIRNVRT